MNMPKAAKGFSVGGNSVAARHQGKANSLEKTTPFRALVGPTQHQVLCEGRLSSP